MSRSSRLIAAVFVDAIMHSIRTLTLFVAAAAILLRAAEVRVVRAAEVRVMRPAEVRTANPGEEQPTCLRVLTGAFAQNGREDEPAMLRAIAAQLGMTPERLKKVLTDTHGGVASCFNRLTVLAR